MLRACTQKDVRSVEKIRKFRNSEFNVISATVKNIFAANAEPVSLNTIGCIAGINELRANQKLALKVANAAVAKRPSRSITSVTSSLSAKIANAKEIVSDGKLMGLITCANISASICAPIVLARWSATRVVRRENWSGIDSSRYMAALARVAVKLSGCFSRLIISTAAAIRSDETREKATSSLGSQNKQGWVNIKSFARTVIPVGTETAAFART